MRELLLRLVHLLVCALERLAGCRCLALLRLAGSPCQLARGLGGLLPGPVEGLRCLLLRLLRLAGIALPVLLLSLLHGRFSLTAGVRCLLRGLPGLRQAIRLLRELVEIARQLAGLPLKILLPGFLLRSLGVGIAGQLLQTAVHFLLSPCQLARFLRRLAGLRLRLGAARHLLELLAQLAQLLRGLRARFLCARQVSGLHLVRRLLRGLRRFFRLLRR